MCELRVGVASRFGGMGVGKRAYSAPGRSWSGGSGLTYSVGEFCKQCEQSFPQFFTFIFCLRADVCLPQAENRENLPHCKNPDGPHNREWELEFLHSVFKAEKFTIPAENAVVINAYANSTMIRRMKTRN